MDLPTREDGKPLAIVVVGMAGAGKTTLLTALYSYLIHAGKKVYGINLDPACDQVPFPANIDIRTTVNYKNVMKQYGLGPNGAIMTCLNLYATRFDQVLQFIEKRQSELDYILIDTPGQIEVFNWSASGTIILDSLAITVPTMIAFTIDSVRCQRPTTLMANMMYACSVLYKSKLPFIGVFTKSDLVDPTPQMLWVSDPKEFADAANTEDTYAASLSKSLAVALAQFYDAFRMVPVAIAASEVDSLVGMDKLIEASKDAEEEYFDHYLGWIREQRERISKEKEAAVEAESRRFAEECSEED
eukprot:Gregarina_sp_Pseudo_9__1701@NODE_2152_length_1125_cov_27_981584_g1982_i0_p1_GENE_NODE_2152_length_1125_cov_27_981584_g1982_i0NODE_2152_length_1125_cov_27_981584_g1982_i0_p1_ORF_typecomplete_len301_score38_39ATP_bind_1/PF03029_17/1_9e74VirC1/PF07015_11/1_9e08AAA_31/PF13614_6/9e08MipZ/PF09140_11/6_1e06SRPRB/PF09439_10/9_2e06SRP54/PF00448_22/3e05AAA_16/PF13191_6/9_6e05AAA_16/PF13191_6/1_5e03NTPase_1/PF03266_15/5_1e05GTP_EFTU/PF00009_27/8e05Zeta_toxin/PF06414_12/0_0004Zeta_toxin/PF06414_12/1_1e03CLP